MKVILHTRECIFLYLVIHFIVEMDGSWLIHTAMHYLYRDIVACRNGIFFFFHVYVDGGFELQECGW